MNVAADAWPPTQQKPATSDVRQGNCIEGGEDVIEKTEVLDAQLRLRLPPTVWILSILHLAGIRAGILI
jgi:hypothetical protein